MVSLRSVCPLYNYSNLLTPIGSRTKAYYALLTQAMSLFMKEHIQLVATGYLFKKDICSNITVRMTKCNLKQRKSPNASNYNCP